MKPIVSALVAIVPLGLVTFASPAFDWPQWRGPSRNGVSGETGLLQEWPDGGPKLLWRATNAGSGYSTPAVVGDRLYLLGSEGLENEFVAAHSVRDGQRIWVARLGKVGNPDQKPSFPTARSTPTVVGDLLYALGSDGDLACVETAAGKIRWQKNLRSDFGGKPGVWAYSESPLIDGDALVCSPGGSDATIVALNRKTGDVLWKCSVPEGDPAAYASAVVVETGGIRQYVQLLENGLVGIDAKSGKFLWRYDKAKSKYGANIPTPLAADDFIYVASAGTGGGAVKLAVRDGRIVADPVYFESNLPTSIGGAVKVGNQVYGTTGQALVCFDLATGRKLWEDRSIGAASLCLADHRLYLHGENGQVALVEPTSEGYREKGRFTPPGIPARSNPMEKAWTHPVVANGRLYLRDNDTFWCYDLQAPRS